MARTALGLALLVTVASPAAAEVRTFAASGFEVEHRLDTRLDPARLYELLGKPAGWWSDSHTYSGKAANLTLDLRPGGCWCEAMPGGGGIEHLRVIQAQPGRSLVLMGALGPLLREVAVGGMFWTIAPSGTGSSLVLNYRVAGFYKADGARWASLVDGMLAGQMANLRKAAEERAGSR